MILSFPVKSPRCVVSLVLCSGRQALIAGDVTKRSIKSIQDLNKTLRFAQQSADAHLRMTRVVEDINDLCLVCFSDAAFGARPDGSNQGGYMIVMTSREILQGAPLDYNIVGWRSFKLPRVCRSSLSAEGQACSTALDELMMLKTMVSLMLQPDLDPKDPETAASFGESAIVIDAKGLFDAMKKDCIGSGADKCAAIDILCIREELARLRCNLRWVSSERMLADGLTKQHARQAFVEMLRGKTLQLVQDDSFTAAKKKDRAERARSMATTFGDNRIAEKISMVVLADSFRSTEGSEIEASDELQSGSHFYIILFAVALVFLTELIVFSFRAFRVMKSLCGRRQVMTVDVACQVRADREISLLEAMQARVDQLEAEKAELELLLQHAATSHLAPNMPVYYTARGERWHIYQDCHSLRSSVILLQERLCQACIDRANRR